MKNGTQRNNKNPYFFAKKVKPKKQTKPKREVSIGTKMKCCVCLWFINLTPDAEVFDLPVG
jgi:hypothetical protein